MTQLQFDATVLPNGVLTIPLPIQWQSRNVKVVVEANENCLPHIVPPDLFGTIWEIEDVVSPSDVESTETQPPLPEGFNPMMLGIIDPKMYGRGKILGDIMTPISEILEE